ncbi:hypothetical protein D8Y22_03060 [Salinadaptatus halalkaliphilus]|uniref:Uncharacterized protein n=1 Tax=Salinadaptatus halalkaliphilus TaxID=2419781 RepID=A0A4S3TUC4_9EURY|nr:hypothetical protein D8Y22_03060 [Salinadaptatus halalkaliphilus]
MYNAGRRNNCWYGVDATVHRPNGGFAGHRRLDNRDERFDIGWPTRERIDRAADTGAKSGYFGDILEFGKRPCPLIVLITRDDESFAGSRLKHGDLQANEPLQGSSV